MYDPRSLCFGGIGSSAVEEEDASASAPAGSAMAAASSAGIAVTAKAVGRVDLAVAKDPLRAVGVFSFPRRLK